MVPPKLRCLLFLAFSLLAAAHCFAGGIFSRTPAGVIVYPDTRFSGHAAVYPDTYFPGHTAVYPDTYFPGHTAVYPDTPFAGHTAAVRPELVTVTDPSP